MLAVYLLQNIELRESFYKNIEQIMLSAGPIRTLYKLDHIRNTKPKPRSP